LFAVAVPVGAGDLNRLLTGDYVGYQAFTCALSSGGFNPEDLSRKPNPSTSKIEGYNQSGSSQGVTSFDGLGRYTYKGEVLSVTYEPAGSTAPAKYPVNQFDMDCTGNYEVDENLQVRTWGGECTLTPMAGFYALIDGFRFEISNTESKGRLIGTMGNILSVRIDSQPNIEIVKIYNPALKDPVTAERICTSSGSGMKIVGKGKNVDLMIRMR
jgi:hypothetical protein